MICLLYMKEQCENCADGRHGVPDIFNTDHGAQYTGKTLTGVLKNHSIKVSMDGKGCAMDNIFIERLWRSVEYGEIYKKEYLSVTELNLALNDYFEFYNTCHIYKWSMDR